MKISGRNGEYLISENRQIHAIAPSLNDAMRLSGIEPEPLPKAIARDDGEDDESFSELLKLLED
jgi:hypothetical protein